MQTVNLNGGTLMALMAQTAFFNNSVSTNAGFTVNLLSDSTFDTNGYDVGMGLPLLGTTAGFTKIGAGNLTLVDGNTYTGDTHINAGQLTLTGANPTQSGTIYVANGAALGVDYLGGTPASGTNTNVSFANNTTYSVTTDGSTISMMDINQLSSDAGAAVLIDLGNPIPNSTLSGTYAVLNGASAGTNTPSVMPRFATFGLKDVTASVSGGVINVTFTDASSRGFVGDSGESGGGDQNWGYSEGTPGFGYQSNWAISLGNYEVPPGTDGNGVNEIAPFNSSAWYATQGGDTDKNHCILDVVPTVNTMLFNVSNGYTTGFVVDRVTAGSTNAITLSAVGSTLSAEASVQVLSGVNSINPDVKLGVDTSGTVQFYLAVNSELDLNGALMEDGGAASLDVVGGVGGTADTQGMLVLNNQFATGTSNWSGNLSVNNAMVSTDYLSAGQVTLQDATLTYTGASMTIGGGLVTNGSNVSFNVTDAGSTVTVAADNPGTALSAALTKGGSGELKITTGVADPYLGHDLNITGGTLNLASTVATLYNVTDRFGPVDAPINTNGTLLLSPTSTFQCNAVRLAYSNATADVTIQGGRFIDNYWMYIGGADGMGGAGTVTLRDTNVSTGSELSVGRDSGQGVLNLTGSASLNVGAWMNVGCWDGGNTGNGAKGTLTLTDSASLTQNSSAQLGCYTAGSYGLLKMDGTSTLTMGSGGFEMAADVGGTGVIGADIDIGGSATANIGGHFYAAGVWSDSTMECHATITLSDHGTLNTGTVNPEWTQLGYGNDAQTNTFILSMSGNSLFNNQQNVGMVYGNCSGTVSMSDSSLLVANGTLRLGYGGSFTATLSDSAMIVATGPLVMGNYHGNNSVVLQGNSGLTAPSVTVGQYGATNSTFTVSGTGSHVTTDMMALGWNWGNDANDVGTNNTVTVNGGTVAIHGGAGTYGQVDDGGTPGDHTYSFLNGLVIGGCGAAGTYNQNGGITTNDNPVALGQFDFYYWDIENAPWPDPSGASAGSGVLNLNGGTFSAPSFVVQSNIGVTTDPGSTQGTINFNGGVLQASADSADFISVADAAGAVTLNVMANGAKIDTNGHSVTLNQPLLDAGGGGVTKMGAGKLTLTAASTYTGATVVKQGTVQLNGPDARNPILAVGGADIQHGWSTMVFDYSGAGDSDPTGGPTGVLALLTASYHGGLWDTGKFLSSTAVAEGTTLGWKDDTGAMQVTVMSTLPGDGDLSGTVDSTDLGLVINNYNHAGEWDTGDFNYDGVVDSTDLGFVINNYNHALPLPSEVLGGNLDAAGIAMLGAAGIHVVPEPGTLALLAAGLLGLLAYAWRKRK